MTDARLHALVIPSDAQLREQQVGGQKLAKLAGLSGSQPVTTAAGNNPEDLTLAGTYRGLLADIMAGELRGLASASDIDVVPYRPDDPAETLPDRGYYAVESADIEPTDPREPGVQEFTVRATRRGTRKSHTRAVDTTVASVTTDFGSAETARIRIDDRAIRPRWQDPVSGATEGATVISTDTGESATYLQFDAEGSSYTDPRLVYDLPYQHEQAADARVWDDRGVAKTTTVDGTDIVQWRRVYGTGHDYAGVPVVDTGRLRLHFDESGGLTAETWDTGSSSWTSTSLGASDWELEQFDATYIGDARVDAQVTFVDLTQSPTARYALDMTVGRGDATARWFRPQNEQDATPAGLQTLLSPIARGSLFDPQPRNTLIPLSEVRD